MTTQPPDDSEPTKPPEFHAGPRRFDPQAQPLPALSHPLTAACLDKTCDFHKVDKAGKHVVSVSRYPLPPPPPGVSLEFLRSSRRGKLPARLSKEEVALLFDSDCLLRAPDFSRGDQ